MNILIFSLALMAMIILHELGHFAAAKWCGMRVEKFSLFFGSTPLRKRIGETEYGVGWLPLGGYVRISGMTRDEKVRGEPTERLYWKAPTWKRVVVIIAGPAVNVVCALALFFVFFMSGVPEANNRIDQVTAGAPAASAGIRAGDQLIGVGEVVSADDPQPLQEEIVRNSGREVLITVERDGERVERLIPLGSGASASDPPLGIQFAVSNRSFGLSGSASASVSTSIEQTRLMATSIVRLFHSEEARSELTTIVGIGAFYEDASNLGLALYYIASISLLLGLFNLLPILPLDGGHIAIAIVEKLRGRTFSGRIYAAVGLAGLILLLVGLSFGVNNDFGRFTGEGFTLQ